MSKPKDFKYEEAKKLLSYYGFREFVKGKTSGSRVAFVDDEKRVFVMHKAHSKDGDTNLKEYVIRDLIKFIKKLGE